MTYNVLRAIAGPHGGGFFIIGYALALAAIVCIGVALA